MKSFESISKFVAGVSLSALALSACSNQEQAILHASCETTAILPVEEEVINGEVVTTEEQITLNGGATLLHRTKDTAEGIVFSCESIDGTFISSPVLKYVDDSANGLGIYTVQYPSDSERPSIDLETATLLIPYDISSDTSVQKEFEQLIR